MHIRGGFGAHFALYLAISLNGSSLSLLLSQPYRVARILLGVYSPPEPRHRILKQLTMATHFSLSPCSIMWNDSGYMSLVLPVLLILPAWYWLRKRAKSTLPYPPGPKPYPLIGNLLDFPLDVPLWEGLASIAKQHGRILPSLELPTSKCRLLTSNDRRDRCPSPQTPRNGGRGSEHQ